MGMKNTCKNYITSVKLKLYKKKVLCVILRIVNERLDS